MTAFSIRRAAAATLIATLALITLGAGAGKAEDIKSPRDAASGQASGRRDAASGLPTGRRQYEPVIIRKYEDIEATLATLRSQMATLQTQCDELQALYGEAAAADEAAAAESEQMLAQIDEAQKIFDEQVAALLDPALSSSVSQSLDNLRKQYPGTIQTDTDGSGVDDAASLLSLLAQLDESIGEIEIQAAQGKSTQVTRSNISNN
ncbi:hypothetical protein IT575_08225 [bacterium]|nr:hypothetical protein [bacterium]